MSARLPVFGPARLLAAAAALAPLSPALGVVTAIETVTVRDDQLPSQPFYNLDFEGNYLPNVVLRENGAASFEALKAQAVAARSFAYHLIQDTSATFIRNSQADQVYSLGGIQGNPGGLWDQAVRETAGEVLTFANVTTAAFYVAGAIPSGPSAVAGPGDPDPTNTEQWVTYTFENGDLGNFNLGTPLGFQGTPSNPNLPNRGAQSQNGADFLSDNGVHYLDILKYYYGGDIQVEQAVQAPGATVYDAKPLASFERNEETFARSLTFAGQTQNLITANTDAARTFAESNSGSWSQELTFDYDSAGDVANEGFFARHLSGALNSRELISGNAVTITSDPSANVLLPTEGSVSFYLKADPGDVAPGANLQVGIAIDDFGDNTIFKQTEQSQFQDVVADGQWHKYEFFLTDDEFDPGFGSLGNGVLNDRFSLDSILFQGFGDATVYLDDVTFDAAAIFVQPPAFASDFNGDGTVDLLDFDILAQNFNTVVSGQQFGDANGDGVVALLDFDILAQEFGSTAPATVPGAVPEPASLGLLSLGGLAATRRRR